MKQFTTLYFGVDRHVHKSYLPSSLVPSLYILLIVFFPVVSCYIEISIIIRDIKK